MPCNSFKPTAPKQAPVTEKSNGNYTIVAEWLTLVGKVELNFNQSDTVSVKAVKSKMPSESVDTYTKVAMRWINSFSKKGKKWSDYKKLAPNSIKGSIEWAKSLKNK